MVSRYVLCRVAYEATDTDPTTRDRRLRDFPAATMTAAEGSARRWARNRNAQRTAADRSAYPWVIERWNSTTRSWDLVARVT